MSALDFPSSPVNGQTFVDGPRTWTFNSFYGVWNITSEGIIGQTGFTGSIGFTGSKGSTTVSPSAPTSPINGDLWWNSETGVRYVFYTDGTSNQWVQDSAGVKGSTGFVGSQGITGFTGSFGITGFTGSFGPVAGSNTQLVYNNSGIAAGANVFFDNTNGNVGIGLSPTAKLHVAGTIQSSSGSTTAQMFADGGAAYFTSVGSYPSIFSTNSAERMRITSDGYLLVGGTTTGLGAAGRGLVDINGSGSAALGLSAGGTLAGYIFHDGTTGMSVWQERNGFMAFGTNAAEKMRLTAAGNLGIGTTAPGSILDVRTAAGSGTFLTLVNTSATLNTNVIETSYTLSNAQTGSSTVAVIGATNPFAVGNTYGDIYFKTTNPTSGLVERMRIDSAGNVGIGTTAPLAKLDVNGQGLFQGSTSSTYRGANIGALNINNNTVDGTVDFTQGLVFTDNTNNSGAWAHAGIVATGSEGFRGSLVFGTVNTGEKSNTVIERMRITPGGNLGIGTSGPNAPLDVTATLSGFSASGGSIQRLTNPSSTGQSPLDFFINGTLRGRFRSDYAGNMNYVTNGGAHYFFIGGDSGVGTVPVSISSAGVLQVNGLLDLSGGTGQIKFPAAQVASANVNTLDDYEEGNWTPRLSGSLGGNYTPGGINAGRYIKIGKMVYAACNLEWTAQVTAYSGNLIIADLPFTSAGARAVGALGGVSSGLSFTAGYSSFMTVMDPGYTFFYILQGATSGSGYSHNPTVGTTGIVYGLSIVYEAAN